MRRYFNVTGACNPKKHYMVDLQSRLAKIKALIDRGDYFIINRARQYGKTTILRALGEYLKNDYQVISLDFQLLSRASFENENSFVRAFCAELLVWIENENSVPLAIVTKLEDMADDSNDNLDLTVLFRTLSKWCLQSEKSVVLIIDEVDSATNNQVFLDFLALLRGYYINREERPTFQSVILAGVYDVKNMKHKIRANEEHKLNSPWNIAADFNIDMSFGVNEIKRMLEKYETDHATGMNIETMARLLYDYTSGYPFLVSKLCKLMDEQIAGSDLFPDKKAVWTESGFQIAVKSLLSEKNTLFESMVNKLYDYPELKKTIYSILFTGITIPYNALDSTVEIAAMFGFVKNVDGTVAVANRIFETVFYNLFLTSEDIHSSDIFVTAQQEKNQFIQNGHLDMERILEKFVLHFDELYGDRPDKFVEEDGRRYFLLYLRPIINGIGNYYIEARTRNMERTDVIVDYQGEQFIIELKIWRGNEYHTRGENQITDYLEHYHLDKGYMLSFNFNKKKEIGVNHLKIGNKTIVEAVV